MCHAENLSVLRSPQSENISPGQHAYGTSSDFGIMPYPLYSPKVKRNSSASRLKNYIKKVMVQRITDARSELLQTDFASA